MPPNGDKGLHLRNGKSDRILEEGGNGWNKTPRHAKNARATMRRRQRKKYNQHNNSNGGTDGYDNINPDDLEGLGPQLAQDVADQNKVADIGMGSQFFYSEPNSRLITILIMVVIFIVIFFMVVFRWLIYPSLELNDSTNASISIYLTMVALPVGVTLSFIVASAWATFSDAQAKEAEEASQLFLLYNLVGEFPGTEEILAQIRRYTAYVIDVEFPLFATGNVTATTGFDQLIAIGDAILALNPADARQSVIYGQATSMFERIVALRIIRRNYASNGIALELWWVLILGVVIVIFISLFLYMKSFGLQLLMVCLAATVLVALLFIIKALDFPYRGDFGLDSLPFELAFVSMIDQLNDSRDKENNKDDGSNTTKSTKRSRSTRSTKSSKYTTPVTVPSRSSSKSSKSSWSTTSEE